MLLRTVFSILKINQVLMNHSLITLKVSLNECCAFINIF